MKLFTNKLITLSLLVFSLNCSNESKEEDEHHVYSCTVDLSTLEKSTNSKEMNACNTLPTNALIEIKGFSAEGDAKLELFPYSEDENGIYTFSLDSTKAYLKGKSHTYSHEGHSHEGHDHSHEGHDHSHEGHDHSHEGHSEKSNHCLEIHDINSENHALYYNKTCHFVTEHHGTEKNLEFSSTSPEVPSSRKIFYKLTGSESVKGTLKITSGSHHHHTH